MATTEAPRTESRYDWKPLLIWGGAAVFLVVAVLLMALAPTSVHEEEELAESMSAGTAVPDAAGSITLALPPPAQTAQTPVIGVLVTQEPAKGSPKPVGRLLLARYPIQP